MMKKVPEQKISAPELFCKENTQSISKKLIKVE